MRKETEQTEQKQNNNKQTAKPSVGGLSDISADGQKRRTALDRAAEVFAEATGGRRFGFAGKYLSKWTQIVKEHGEDTAIQAVKIWGETLDDGAFEGPKSLRNPAAAFLAHASDEAIAEAKVDIQKTQKQEEEIVTRNAEHERLFREGIERYGAQMVSRGEELSREETVSRRSHFDLYFRVDQGEGRHYWLPLEDAEAHLKRQAQVSREFEASKAKKRDERIEARTLELLDERFGPWYSPKTDEDRATYNAAGHECNALATKLVDAEMNARQFTIASALAQNPSTRRDRGVT